MIKTKDFATFKSAKMLKSVAVIVGAASLMLTTVHADQLDTVIKRGTLNCGVVLDFPPMGYFDQDNNAAGFDVDYCNDLAAALGVKSNVLNLTWGDRIPSLISGKTDVVVGSTSDTLERAKSVGFSSPYFVFKFQVFSKSGSNINSFDDLKDVKVGAALGTTYETEYLAYAKAQGWGDSNYTAFKSENDAFLGLYQGKVDAIISTNTNIATKLQTAEFKDYAAGPFVPNYDDVVGLIAKRSELAWINYLNLFLVHQIRDGKLNEHYNQHFGSDAPADLIQSLRDNK
ncbi:MAG: transporter substrate-binding domain-containing protein [Reinekea forsetii]|jgi:polar amino acid transport system substrate-binding protein|uniref:Amino acid ABC transporter, substrate-binding protein n=2 Tax=Reinekea TaxID=230494 RepID=A0A2K8KLA3_9GAMM|nr:transporter substrate-binding domain-containing protein [Reinekea forsetii]ATX75703.1 amino acid ABC transporter, substrate-binding protein [Reinekea forsetii]MDO7644561.1 transporter substrate-binding domain-containing protein [Reinekea forsetii]MDO7673098.1 transporter substrate-binding domain-containing protein [Reinekea forsetii]